LLEGEDQDARAVVDLLKQFIEAQKQNRAGPQEAQEPPPVAARVQALPVLQGLVGRPPAIVTPWRDWQILNLFVASSAWANRTQANPCRRHSIGASGVGNSNSPTAGLDLSLLVIVKPERGAFVRNSVVTEVDMAESPD
jgi:hypothetical protein